MPESTRTRPSRSLRWIVPRLLLSLAVGAITLAILWPIVRPRVVRPARREGAFRIYVLGGSTSEGIPYAGRCDFGQIVSFLFDGELGGAPIEVCNHGDAGEDAAFARHEAETIARSEKTPGSAVALVYSGHNEFVAYDSSHDLSKSERRLFDVPLVDAATRARILAEYERAITGLLDVFAARRIPVVLATLAANLADWEPNRSVLDDPAHEAAVLALLTRGDEALASGDAGAAVAAFEEAVLLEPGFAWSQKRLGDALRAAGRSREALAAYRAANDADARPDSATSEQNAFLRRIAAERGIALVDAEAIVAAASPDGLPGYSLFWDNCHPRLEGYALIGAAFADAVAELTGVPRARNELDLDALAHHLGIDAEFEARARARQGQYCYGVSTLVFDPRARLAHARELLESALDELPGDGAVLCSMAVLATFEGDPEKTRLAWRRANAADPELTRTHLEHPRVRELLRGREVSDPLGLRRKP